MISAEVAAVVGTAAHNKYLSIGLSNCLYIATLLPGSDRL